MTPDPLSTIKAAIAQAQKLRADMIAYEWPISDRSVVAGTALLRHARNTDPWAALAIAVKALEETHCDCPGRHFNENDRCALADAENTLVEMARALAPEVKP